MSSLVSDPDCEILDFVYGELSSLPEALDDDSRMHTLKHMEFFKVHSFTHNKQYWKYLLACE